MAEHELRDLVTATRDRLDNSILTVRHNGKVIGKVLQWGEADWRVAAEDPLKFPTMEATIDWLLGQEARQRRSGRGGR